jgi:hypothetical protein
MPEAALACHHRGRGNEQSDAAKENVYDENCLEDAVHIHAFLVSESLTGANDFASIMKVYITQIYLVQFE